MGPNTPILSSIGEGKLITFLQLLKLPANGEEGEAVTASSALALRTFSTIQTDRRVACNAHGDFSAFL
jgi:hypothetical protein